MKPLPEVPNAPTGFPQFVILAMAMRSPVCTATGGDSVTVLLFPVPALVVSNGPRSAVIVNVFPLRRKNLIFAAPVQEVLQPNFTVEMVPLPVAGLSSDMSVRIGPALLSLALTEGRSTPTVTVCADKIDAKSTRRRPVNGFIIPPVVCKPISCRVCSACQQSN